jgi:preprotein translocase subunit SecA
MSSETLRPGIARGLHPERAPSREGWLDRLAHGLGGALARALPGRAAALRAFARQVEEQGTGLRALDARALGARIDDLRSALLREGSRDALLAPSFALVREVARRTLGMEPYDVQIQGGFVMAKGMLAEMEAGEGKTLTATLPACTAALAGIPVHVISANDYLVERDAEAMRPLYAAFGLSVGAVTDRDRDPERRRSVYECDVVYGTAQQIAFDYLRDGLERGRQRATLSLRLEALHRERPRAERMLLRGLCFAIVDEADSVLIDEARTPLILSGPGGPAEDPATHRRALRLAGALEEGLDFCLDRRARRVELTERGRERLAALAQPLPGFWSGPRRREAWVSRALAALHLYVRDRDYLVREDKVEIVDQPTGRVARDRAWERGLHQLIEAREACAVTPQRETVARISYQQFFRRYLRLAGMTGTAREVTRELWSVYGLRTQSIPTRLPSRRLDAGTRVFTTQEQKWAAVTARVEEAHRRGQPVLIGTASVALSEQLSARLAARELPHQVLNARQDADEARIVAEAGCRGAITVATAMAGRGTDILLAPGVAEVGGLYVIATQRAEASRIDRQLFGRCGRHGELGSFEAVLSLEDPPLLLFYPPQIRRLVSRVATAGTPLFPQLGKVLTRVPQIAEERVYSRMRRRLVDLERSTEDLLAFSGRGE